MKTRIFSLLLLVCAAWSVTAGPLSSYPVQTNFDALDNLLLTHYIGGNPLNPVTVQMPVASLGNAANFVTDTNSIFISWNGTNTEIQTATNVLNNSFDLSGSVTNYLGGTITGWLYNNRNTNGYQSHVVISNNATAWMILRTDGLYQNVTPLVFTSPDLTNWYYASNYYAFAWHVADGSQVGTSAYHQSFTGFSTVATVTGTLTNNTTGNAATATQATNLIGTLNASQLTGTLATARLSGDVVTSVYGSNQTNTSGQLVLGQLGNNQGVISLADSAGLWWDTISGGNNAVAISTNLTVQGTNTSQIFSGSGRGLSNILGSAIWSSINLSNMPSPVVTNFTPNATTLNGSLSASSISSGGNITSTGGQFTGNAAGLTNYSLPLFKGFFTAPGFFTLPAVGPSLVTNNNMVGYGGSAFHSSSFMGMTMEQGVYSNLTMYCCCYPQVPSSTNFIVVIQTNAVNWLVYTNLTSIPVTPATFIVTLTNSFVLNGNTNRVSLFIQSTTNTFNPLEFFLTTTRQPF